MTTAGWVFMATCWVQTTSKLASGKPANSETSWT